jgi:hypothetical protein
VTVARVRASLSIIVVGVASACSAGAEPESPSAPVFGAAPGPCGVTVLTNDAGDEASLRASVECALGQVDARSAFRWDLLVPTVEGDPILYRFVGDGELVTITTDTTRDAFGSPSVLVQECETIDDTGFVPLGVDCTDAEGVPFVLPDGIWPP